MRVAIIEGDVVVNVIEAPANYQAPQGATVVQSDVAGPGWTYVNGTFTPPADVQIVPAEVDMWKFRAAMDAAGKTAAMDAYVAGAAAQTKAYWTYGATVRRDSDAVAALAVALTMNAAAVDSVFAAAGGMSL